jgi:hypothetical protein
LTHVAREILSFAVAALMLAVLALAMNAPVWLGGAAALCSYFGLRLFLPLADDQFAQKRAEHLTLCQEKLAAYHALAQQLPPSDQRTVALSLAATLAKAIEVRAAETDHPQPLPELPERLDHLNRLLEKYQQVIRVGVLDPTNPEQSAALRGVLDHTREILEKTESRYKKRIEIAVGVGTEDKVIDLARETQFNQAYLQLEQELEQCD